jgi:hypothetical protein
MTDGPLQAKDWLHRDYGWGHQGIVMCVEHGDANVLRHASARHQRLGHAVAARKVPEKLRNTYLYGLT